MSTDQHVEGTSPSMDEISSVAAERSGMNRRGFLATAGAFSAAAFLVACGSDKKSDGSSTDTDDDTTTTGDDMTTTTAGSGGGGDLDIAAFAASLEVLAVGTYGAALDAATAGKLGDVPPAVAEFVTTAKKQHQDQLDALNKLLTDNGKDAVSTPPKELEASVNEEFGKVKDIAGAAKLARSLEQAAAATYLAAIPELTEKGSIDAAASIQIIDMQHVAILNFALGEYPVPDTFASTDAAVKPG